MNLALDQLEAINTMIRSSVIIKSNTNSKGES